MAESGQVYTRIRKVDIDPVYTRVRKVAVRFRKVGMRWDYIRVKKADIFIYASKYPPGRVPF